MVLFQYTRIAPTPSGYLHAGNALNFLLTDALAQRHGASLLLRIDDADRERVRPEYVADIFETLHWLGIRWQGGPKDAGEFKERWSQQHRAALYEEALQALRNNNAVFACTCSRTQAAQGLQCACRGKALPLDTPTASWRLATEPGAAVKVKTLEGRTLNAALPPQMQNVVVRRKDGLPAYQLTSVVDDVHFGVDLIVRGQDLWPSTLAQLYLSRLLNFEAFEGIVFLHHPLLTDDGGAKLSKSAGASSLKQRRERGGTKEELLAFIAQRLKAPGPVRTGNDLLTAFGLGGN